MFFFFFFSSRRRHTRSDRDWSSDVCSSDLTGNRRHDRAFGAEQKIEHARFAGVGLADNRGARPFAHDTAALEAIVQKRNILDEPFYVLRDLVARRQPDILVGKVDFGFEMSANADDLAPQTFDALRKCAAEMGERLP